MAMFTIQAERLQISLLFLICVTLAQRQCDLTAVVGDTVTIPLGDPNPKDLKTLVWRHRTGKGLLTVGGGTIGHVTSDGSLVLRDVQMSHSGQYSGCACSSDEVERVTLTLCVTKPVYELLGADMELDPDVKETLNNITWQRGRYTVARWNRHIGHDYYNRCETEDQCVLNPTTGVLTMKGLKPEDEGRYFAEINGETPVTGLDLTLLRPVSKPNVTTSCNETQCTLTCVGEETKHTKYSWKVNGETVNEGNKTFLVERTGDRSKSYTCVFSNPKSEEGSDPLTERDLFPGSATRSRVAAVLPVVALVAAAALAAGIYFKRKVSSIVLVLYPWRNNSADAVTGRVVSRAETPSVVMTTEL